MSFWLNTMAGSDWRAVRQNDGPAWKIQQIFLLNDPIF